MSRIVTASTEPRRRAKLDAQAAIDAASAELARGAIGDAEWSRRVSDALARSYLREDDPRWQSGFDGDAALWRQAREPVLAARSWPTASSATRARPRGRSR